jgi:two-component system, OmpR family, response regulator
MSVFLRCNWYGLRGNDCVQTRILLVEDDDATASYIIDALCDEGFAVDRANDGRAGLALARRGTYSAIILDRMLPEMDGMAVLNGMRVSDVTTPTIFLSALGSVDDRVEGLRAGSQDYLAKPFAIAELVARVHALLRQTPAADHAARHVFGDLILDRIERTVHRDGQPIDLQPREFRLLEYLMRRAGQIVTRKMLLEGVWDYHFDPGTNVIDVHVSRLRKKLDEGFRQEILHTIRGVGYRLGDADE